MLKNLENILVNMLQSIKGMDVWTNIITYNVSLYIDSSWDLLKRKYMILLWNHFMLFLLLVCMWIVGLIVEALGAESPCILSGLHSDLLFP